MEPLDLRQAQKKIREASRVRPHANPPEWAEALHAATWTCRVRGEAGIRIWCERPNDPFSPWVSEEWAYNQLTYKPTEGEE